MFSYIKEKSSCPACGHIGKAKNFYVLNTDSRYRHIYESYKYKCPNCGAELKLKLSKLVVLLVALCIVVVPLVFVFISSYIAVTIVVVMIMITLYLTKNITNVEFKTK